MEIPKEAVEKATDMGWRYKGAIPVHDDNCRRWYVRDDDGGYIMCNMYAIALDPIFWHCFVRGIGYPFTLGIWRKLAIHFYDLILTGEDTKAFWDGLL